MESGYLGVICVWSVLVGVMMAVKGLIGMDDGKRRNIVIFSGTSSILIPIICNILWT